GEPINPDQTPRVQFRCVPPSGDSAMRWQSRLRRDGQGSPRLTTYVGSGACSVARLKHWPGVGPKVLGFAAATPTDLSIAHSCVCEPDSQLCRTQPLPLEQYSRTEAQSLSPRRNFGFSLALFRYFPLARLLLSSRRRVKTIQCKFLDRNSACGDAN